MAKLSKTFLSLALLSAATALSPATASMQSPSDEDYVSSANDASPAVVEAKPKPRCRWVNGMLVCSF